MTSEAIQQIKERLSIVDVVAPYVELHQAGKSLKGKSPFTNEKTPSFFVSPDRGMYYCFSTSQGGDIFTFIEAMEGVDFKDALKILAEKAGVELVPEDPKKRTARETGYTVLEEATNFFTEKLSSSEDANKYLADRGVNAETINKWRIGYAPGPPNDGWRELRAYLTGKKYTDLQMTNTGLIKGGIEGKEAYDVFRDRIMFPIFDAGGKVIAFSGRILNKNDKAPKYVNSPETEFFNKSEALYGYNKAKYGIRQYDFSLIVEGQFDVVLSHQAGYINTVAVSGTALTPYHVGLLQRLSNRVVLALDSDRAGIAAVKRAADVMLSRGIDVKVAHMPEGSDPADIIHTDPKQYKDLIGKATHVIEFLLTILKEQTKDERAYKLIAREEILPFILKIQNQIDAEHFAGIVAKALNTTKNAIQLELARLKEEKDILSQKETIKEPASVGSIIKQKTQQTRKEGLAEYLAVASTLIDEPEKTLLDEEFQTIVNTSVKAILKNMKAEQKSRLYFLLEAEFSDLKKHMILNLINEKVTELRLLTIREALRKQKESMYKCDRLGDINGSKELLEKTTELQKELTKASVLTNIFISQDE